MSTSVNSVTGAAVHDNGTTLGGITNSGVSFAYAGPTSGSYTPETIGQSFTVAANGTGTQAGAAGWAYAATSSGSAITGGLPISYNFTIDKNAGITSSVAWSLHLDTGSGDHLIANGTLNGATANFSGSFNFIDGSLLVGDPFQAYVQVGFTTNVAISPGVVTVTMADTGYLGQGITFGAISAIPEPATYAAIGGAAMLGFAAWRRGRRQPPAATLA